MSATSTATAPEGVQLRCHGGTIENANPLQPLSKDTPIEELRQRYKGDGVIWIKGLLNRDLVQKCRHDYLKFVNEGTGMLKPGTDAVEGIYSGADWRDYILPGGTRVALGLEDEGPFVEKAIQSHVAPFYLQFKEQVGKDLAPFVQSLCDFENPWCLPRSPLRCAVPNAESTPVHYDQIFLRAAPPTSITAWIPIGDVEKNGGGLMYLKRSHDIGKQFEEDFSRRSAGFSDEERILAVNRNMSKGGWLDRNSAAFGKNWARDWLIGEYEAGDVLFHNPFMIHARPVNESPTGRIRVSTDLRFVDKSQPYDQRWEIAAFSEGDPNLTRNQGEKLGK